MPPSQGVSAEVIAERVSRWRPLPRSLLAVLEIRRTDPDARARLADIIASDPDLDRRMRVLGRVSAHVDGEGRSRASEAMRQVGYRRIHNAAVATLVVDALAADAREFDFLDYWRYVATTASLASSIAVAQRSEASDFAYASALLHGAGLLAVDMVAPELLAILRDAIADEGWSEALEHAVMGFSVAEVTAALHVRWRLPVEMSEAHLVLGTPELWESRPLARFISESSEAVRGLGIPHPLHGVGPAGASPAAREVLDQHYAGGRDLLALAEGLIAACLLARDEPALSEA